VLYVLSVPTWTPEVSERIEAFRSVYERARAAIVPAHITLVFGALGINKEELTAYVGWIARQTAPFRGELLFGRDSPRHDRWRVQTVPHDEGQR